MATPIPENRATFTVAEVARATGGRVVRDGGPSVGVCTDSRAVRPGSLFVALVGDTFDGHAFAAAAAAAGAATFLVSRDDVLPESGAVVLVADTRVALGGLARAHRDRWASTPHDGGPRAVVAVTGSAGKTTTRRAIAAVLDSVAPGQTHSSLGNLNNLVGTPMTLLGLEPRQRWAVVEIGTSARGEIAALAAMVRPDVGVLTLVAPAHTEGIGTVDDVAAEKGALFAALGEGHVAVANADDARVMAQLARTGARQVTYGFAPGATYRIAMRRPIGVGGSRVAIEHPAPDGGRERLELSTPLLGDAGALAVAAAFAVAETLAPGQVSTDLAAAALARLAEISDGRLSASRLADGTVVIDDSYNANPASMRSSIAIAAELSRTEKRRLVLVLGEMRELGEVAQGEHDAVGRAAAASGAQYVLAVAGAARHIAERATEAGIATHFAADSAEAVPVALASVRPGDIVLVKGSRGVKTERIVRALAERASAERSPS